MTWDLVWDEPAKEQVDELLAGGDPDMVLALARVGAVLRYCPGSFGESRGGDPRVGFEPPLGVRYEVDYGWHEVRVLEAWSIHRPPRGGDPA